MPSGSHGGSSGSHGGGGSSFGGGSSGGWRGSSSSGSYYNSAPPRPIHWSYGGRTYYVSGVESSPIRTKIVLAVVFFILAIISIIWLASTCSSIHKIKVDRNYYINMIRNAESDSDYCKDGVVTDMFYNQSCDRWYLTYCIPYSSGLWGLEGYTYSVYTEEEARDIYYYHRDMKFAVNNKDVDSRTDSINMEYINIPLTSDGEYLVCVRKLIVSIVMIIVFLGCTALFIYLAIRNIKKKAKVSVDLSKASPETKKKYCRYCGRTLRDSDMSCPSCGASRKD